MKDKMKNKKKKDEEEKQNSETDSEVQLTTGVSPGMMTKDPCGSMATRQALRMLGVSAAEMPHILHVSFRRLLSDWRFLLLSRILQSREGQKKELISDCDKNG